MLVGVERSDLADFLRRRRQLVQPADVGLPAGPRRRTPGLRRHEVAQLAAMSPDYYVRLEQARGPRPSPEMLTALARALRLNLDERNHLFHLAGHPAPPAGGGDEHVGSGLLHLLDALNHLPAQVISDLSVVLAQNAMAVALVGDQTAFTGLARSFAYRWFTDPATRQLHAEPDHDQHSRALVANLRAVVAQRPADPRAAELVQALRTESEEFRALWEQHDVAVRHSSRKRIVHPALGVVEIESEMLVTARQDQRLLVFSPRPGTEAARKLPLLHASQNTATGLTGSPVVPAIRGAATTSRKA